MASPFSFLLAILALAFALVSSLYCPSGPRDVWNVVQHVFAEEIQGQEVVEAFKCFDNKFIYNGCESAYRLNPSGSFNVPPEATNMFCNGPCLIETQLVLNCLNVAFENFLFYNKATVQDFQNALRVGCSYSSQRGNFNEGLFMQGEFSKGQSCFKKWFTVYHVLLYVVGCCFFIILNTE